MKRIETANCSEKSSPIEFSFISGIHSQTMSGNHRPTLPSAASHPTQTRFGFIPRPTTPGIQQAQGTSLVERSRSISPSSANSANAPQRVVAKPQSTTRPAFNRSVTSNTKPKLPPSSPQKDPPKSTTTQRLRSTIPSDTSTKTDVNAIRDRYKTQKRPNFLSRRSVLNNASKPPALETPVIEEEKLEPTISTSIDDSQVEFTRSPTISILVLL